MNWLQKISQQHDDDYGFFHDDHGQRFWGKQGSGILFIRQHPVEGPEILLVHRSQYVEQPLTWGIPGGAMPVGEENPLASARREAEEEIGPVPAGNVVGHYVWTAPSGQFKFTTFIYNVTDMDWNPRPVSWESIDCAWVGVGQASKYDLHFGVSDMLQSYDLSSLDLNQAPEDESKPMAFPFSHDQLPPPEKTYRGVGKIDKLLPPEIADQHRTEYNPSYLGNGDAGVVVDINQLPENLRYLDGIGNVVGKYTTQASEAKNAEWLMKRPIPCCPLVHDVKKLGRGIWFLIMEKVKPISEKETAGYFDYSEAHVRTRYRMQAAKRRMIDCLQENGFVALDDHGRNLGWTTDRRLVILDLGAIAR